MLAIGIAVLAIGSVSEVAEYFPLDLGRKWVYQDDDGAVTGQYDLVGAEQELKGGKASPIITKLGDDVMGSVFYRVTEDAVYVVAFEQNRPLPAPYPILKVGTGKSEWAFTGATQFVGDLSPLNLKGSSKKGPTKEIQGQKYDTVQVTIDAVVGDPNGMYAKSHQTAIYAKGVGLVEMTDESTFNKTKRKHHRKLVSFTPGTSE